MKHYPINSGDAAKIAGGSFTLAELKTFFNALALDIESDKAAALPTDGKERLLKKLEGLVNVWVN